MCELSPSLLALHPLRHRREERAACSQISLVLSEQFLHQNRCVVGDGDKIVINSAELTITLVKADGTQENMFRYRDKQSDVFEKISPGNHRVMWNGSFDFDLSVIHERGEPKWT